MSLKPRYPVYIVSKGRWESRLTAKALERMGVPYHIVVEEQELGRYAAVIDPRKILILEKQYQRDYQTCDDLGNKKSKGPGPARNFAWEHSIKAGFAWHWVMDDNIAWFARVIRNQKVEVSTGIFFRVMEEFVLRYENVAMAGPNYEMFVPAKKKKHPFTLNTRIYSCNLIRNDVPYRWRGRYNEDTDLSLRMLKDGWCTILFNAFVQKKIKTQQMKGGNTSDFYSKEGTFPKTAMLVKLHPDVSQITYRFHRIHHLVDYSRFAVNKLVLKKGIRIPEKADEHGLVLQDKPIRLVTLNRWKTVK